MTAPTQPEKNTNYDSAVPLRLAHFSLRVFSREIRKGDIIDTDLFFGFQARNTQPAHSALYISYRRRDSVDIGTGVAFEIGILHSVAFPKQRIVAASLQKCLQDSRLEDTRTFQEQGKRKCLLETAVLYQWSHFSTAFFRSLACFSGLPGVEYTIARQPPCQLFRSGQV